MKVHYLENLLFKIFKPVKEFKKSETFSRQCMEHTYYVPSDDFELFIAILCIWDAIDKAKNEGLVLISNQPNTALYAVLHLK